MNAHALATEASHKRTEAGLTAHSLVAALLGSFAFDNVLLLHFWGLSPLVSVATGIVAAGLIIVLCRAYGAHLPRVPIRIFLAAFFVALLLLALGGEGRFFYANTDWQIRDAVLRDLATHPWPFAYELEGSPHFLRAPVGMYLLPALFGQQSDFALLLSNSLRLALLLTLAWHLFGSNRQRMVVLGVFLLFSGWDLIGTIAYEALGLRLSWDHLEAWNDGYQYSSNITLAFWVPQHAIAGWTCAVAFLLWRRGRIPVGFFAATIPLTALWSPLAFIGALPFAVLAGSEVLRRRGLRRNDVLLAAFTVAIALPALVYLQVGASDVGMRIRPTPLLIWTAGIVLEVLPFAWPLLTSSKADASDRPVVMTILMMLALLPLVQLGQSSDFQMRVSIVPLALLAILFGEWVARITSETSLRTAAVGYAFAAILIGAATPLMEVRRALINRPAPEPRCSLLGAWQQQDNMIVPTSTYLAAVSALPAAMQDLPAVAGRSDPPTCWDREWALAR